jgi:hypothetical protein
MKKLLALFAVIALAGCATGGNQAYQAAHKSAADRGIAEANARAKSDETLALAVASAGKGCVEDMCRGMAMMALMSMKAAAGSAIQSAAPVIQAPINEGLEWAKVIVNGATGLYGLRVNAAIGLVNATRGAADIDATKEGLSALDVYRDTTTAK